MSTPTITPAPITAPVLPDVDPALGNQLGDEILLSTARSEKVAKVRGASRNGRLQSAASRAWTMGGQVD